MNQDDSPVEVEPGRRQELRELAALIQNKRETLLSEWRQAVRRLPSARTLDTPTLNDHIPSLLDVLAQAFEKQEGISLAFGPGSPVAHGLQRLADGFDLQEVVAEYGILRACLHDLADANGLLLQGPAVNVLNKVFDGAIGLAVKTHAEARALEIQKQREEHLSFLVHDLRTPLNAIAVAARVLDIALPAEAMGAHNASLLASLHRNVEQLSRLIEEVLDENTVAVRGDEIRVVRRRFELWPLTESLIMDQGSVAKAAGVSILNAVPFDLMVDADAGLLRRILENLVANAIRYSPGGRVEVSARRIAATGEVECVVRDNGKGIPSSRLEHVFDHLETDPDQGGGKGLGLEIVKRFVEAHGGKVAAHSREGKGSVFRFTVPEPTRPSKESAPPLVKTGDSK